MEEFTCPICYNEFNISERPQSINPNACVNYKKMCVTCIQLTSGDNCPFCRQPHQLGSYQEPEQEFDLEVQEIFLDDLPDYSNRPVYNIQDIEELARKATEMNLLFENMDDNNNVTIIS